jgi:hypothetical protein
MKKPHIPVKFRDILALPFMGLTFLNLLIASSIGGAFTAYEVQKLLGNEKKVLKELKKHYD